MKNELCLLPTEQVFRNVSFYVKQEMDFGMTRFDAKTLTVQIQPWAQYEHSILLKWIGDGQRRERSMVVPSYQIFFMLLNRADAVVPDDIYDPATRKEFDGGVTMCGRYRSNDPRWKSDLATQVLAAGVTPLMFVDEPGRNRN